MIFDALCSCVKASEAAKKTQAEWYAEDAKHSKPEPDVYSLDLFEPLVVLDGPLYEAYLDAEKNLTVAPVRHIPICFGYVSSAYKHAKGFGSYMVEVVTLEALPDLLARKDKWLDGLAITISQNTAAEGPR